MKHISYGVRQFRKNLGFALKVAAAGGKVTIPSRNRPVAVLGPAERTGHRGSGPEARLRQLVKLGLASPGYIGPAPKLPRLRFSNLGAQSEADRE